MTTSLAANLIEERMLEVEHRQLREGLASLQESIDDAHYLGREALAVSTARTLAWLRREVLAHAAWEEAWIYPSIDQAARSPWATRALRFEHDQIRDAARQLEVAFQAVEERWNSELAFELVAALARVEALVSAHLAQEERFVFPLIEDEQETTRTKSPGRRSGPQPVAVMEVGR